MSGFEVQHEHLPLDGQGLLPEMDLVVAACRAGPGRSFYDVLDFRRRSIDRWTVPLPMPDGVLARVREGFGTERLPLGADSHQEYFETLCMAPHTAQMARNGALLVGLGDPYNGFCVLGLDTVRHRVRFIPDDWREGLFLYGSTGGFRAGGTRWLFLRWPFDGAMDIARGRATTTDVEVWELDTDSFDARLLHRIDATDAGHQITCSPDGRHAVFAPFKWDLNVAYPETPPTESPARYRASHDGGLRASELVTLDLTSGRHWSTPLAVPVIAHAHFDPQESDVLYLSAHHICPTPHGIMIEGPACIYRMRIGEAGPMVEGQYSDDAFFRISQHSVFCVDERPVVAVTNPPNHLDLIDGRTMTLWRRRELFPATPLDLSLTGNALCPTGPETCLSLCVSRDGRYVVLESAVGLRAYDVREDRLLDGPVPQHLPADARVVGHMRTPGE